MAFYDQDLDYSEPNASISLGFRQSHLPNAYGNFLIHQHGDPISKQHANALMNYLRPLQTDYPNIGGNIHLINMPKERIQDEDAYLAAARFESDPGTHGIAFAKTNRREAFIGLNMKGIESMKPNIAHSVVFEHYGKVPQDITGRVLSHEFGHLVEYDLAANRVSRDNIIEGLYHGAEQPGDFGAFKKNWEQRIGNMTGAKFMDLRMDYLQQKDLDPIYRKSFGATRNVPEAIRSRYAQTHDQEMFAETFARARIGEGAGLEGARTFEGEIRRISSASKKTATLEKMAGQTEAAIHSLRWMCR